MLNPNLKRHKPKKEYSVAQYIDGIRAGNRVLLGQAITLIESTLPIHQEKAQAIIKGCLPYSGKSIRIGITGTPGVGKSTFIESLGLHILAQQHQLAVLAVDPSSQVTKGSILGDKTRMVKLSTHQNAFIRPSPAGDSLGGVARKTREIIILCEAAGYDVIFVETVGVGQSEVAVHSMVDFFLLLLLPGGGDELQGIKRGVVEMADCIAINKADGDNVQAAKRSRAAYKNALHLYPPKDSEWIPQAVMCSALQHEGIDKIWELILKFKQQTTKNQYFIHHRQQQAKAWLNESIRQLLQDYFYKNENIKTTLPDIEAAVLSGKLSAYQGAKELMKLFGG